MKSYIKKCIIFIIFGLSLILCLNFANSYCGYLSNILGETKSKSDLIYAVIFGFLSLIFWVIYTFLPKEKYPGFKIKATYNNTKNKLTEKYKLISENRGVYNKEIYLNKDIALMEKIIFIESDKYSENLLNDVNNEIREFSYLSRNYKKSIMFSVIILDQLLQEDLENITSKIITYNLKGGVSSIVIQYVIDKNNNLIIKCPLEYKYFQDIFPYLSYGKKFIEYLDFTNIINSKDV